MSGTIMIAWLTKIGESIFLSDIDTAIETKPYNNDGQILRSSHLLHT
jgi:hypothetical protein